MPGVFARYGKGNGLSLPVRYLREIVWNLLVHLRERLVANRRCITQGACERVTVRDGKLLPMGPSLPVGFAPIVDQTGLRSGLSPLGARPAHILRLDFLRTGT